MKHRCIAGECTGPPLDRRHESASTWTSSSTAGGRKVYVSSKHPRVRRNVRITFVR
jgi:hypothetical protein